MCIRDRRAGAIGNSPGARVSAVSWKDHSGNFWLFGGYGYSQVGNLGNLNDLWEYNLSSGVWTWIGGSSSTGANGIYGTQGIAASSNSPGARQQAVGWLDSSGDFWLFGGFGFDSFDVQDVYKRQGWQLHEHWTALHGFVTPDRAEGQQAHTHGHAGHCQATDAPGIGPVSYTHLDVYKRQHQKQSSSNCTRRRHS